MHGLILPLLATVLLSTATPALACGAAVDAPELARAGAAPVGVMIVPVTVAGRPDLPASNLLTGRIVRADRTLKVTVWYPAAGGAGAVAPTAYEGRVRRPGHRDTMFEIPGCAEPGAAPLKTVAPLVVFSHGYGGWATYTADLAETLASRGYVVAAIDHEDPPFQDAGGFALSFAHVAANRARDQQAVIARLRGLAHDPDFALAGAFDPDRLALIGYSMGGFGALATAGAGYDTASPFYRRIPGDLLTNQAEGQAQPAEGLKALVLIAPWGGQTENRSWSTAALSRVTAPTLLIVGDQDDVAGYADGAQRIYEGLTGADRRMLVFANARHNLVGADAPKAARTAFSSFEGFEEPVWRKDRLRAISAHFIVAFLDLTLKGDTDRADYLKPLPSGGVAKGFSKRWSLGFSLRRDLSARP
jgi:predicted dienelactone hydrolase